MKNNVAFIIQNERLWDPLIQRQAIEPFLFVSTKDKRRKYYLICFLLWYEYLRSYSSIKAIKKELCISQLKVLIIPSFFPLPTPIYSKITGWRFHLIPYAIYIPFLIINALPIYMYLYWFRNVSLFHCRSYQASLAAYVCKKILPGCKFVFDPRSTFPEENVAAGRWTENSFSYRKWKKWEACFLQSADVVISVVNSLTTHYKEIVRSAYIIEIPLCVNTTKFIFNPEFKKKYKLQNKLQNQLIFTFLGNLAEQGWHKPQIYAYLIKSFRALPQMHTFLFLIPQRSEKVLQKYLNLYGIDKTEYIIEHPSFNEVPNYLSIADYGLMYFDEPRINLGVKTIEYWSLGLPILINSNVLGTDKIIKEFNSGLILNIGLGGLDTQCDEELIRNIQQNFINREALRELVKKNYSIESISDKLLAIYEKQMTHDSLRKNEEDCNEKPN